MTFDSSLQQLQRVRNERCAQRQLELVARQRAAQTAAEEELAQQRLLAKERERFDRASREMRARLHERGVSAHSGASDAQFQRQAREVLAQLQRRLQDATGARTAAERRAREAQSHFERAHAELRAVRERLGEVHRQSEKRQQEARDEAVDEALLRRHFQAGEAQ